MPTLTDRHIQVLRFVRDFQQKHGYSASIREIGKKTKIYSTSLVSYYLSDLEDAGFITRVPRVARSIVLLPKAEAELTGTKEAR